MDPLERAGDAEVVADAARHVHADAALDGQRHYTAGQRLCHPAGGSGHGHADPADRAVFGAFADHQIVREGGE